MSLDTNQNNSVDFLFKYIFFGMIQFSAIMMMFTSSLEIIGIVFSVLVAIFISVVGIIDFSNYRLKYFDFISVFIYFALMSIILSSALLFRTMTKLNYQYKTQKAKVEFTRNARQKVNKFKSIFVSLFVAIPILLIASDLNATQQDTYFNPPAELNPINGILYLLKSIFPFSILTGCGYLLYLAIDLIKLNDGNLYVEPKEEKYKVPKRPILNGMFNNVNLGFLANYKTEVV